MLKIKINGKKIKRSYLRLAATYRRFGGSGFDYSKDMLIECFLHESTGSKFSKQNGYVNGKWVKDITVATWIEDIQKGDACKAEFIYAHGSTEIASKNGWWARDALQYVVATPLFGYLS